MNEELLTQIRMIFREELQPLRDEISGIKKDLSTVRDDVGGIKGSIGDIKGQQNETTDWVRALQGQAATAAERVEYLVRTVDQIEEVAAQIEARVNGEDHVYV